MAEVGIRELRQNLSVYLRRVAAGERFVVTERNRPVATLGPPPEMDDPWEKLVAEGRLSRPTGSLLDIQPVDVGDRLAGTRALNEEREERFD